MKTKLLTTVAALALMTGAAYAQGTQQQERSQGGSPSVQQDQKSGSATSPEAKKEGAAPSQENGKRRTQSTQPSGEKPGSASTQDAEKKAQQGNRENTQQRQGQGQSQDTDKKAQQGRENTQQRQGKSDDMKKQDGQARDSQSADKQEKVDLNSEQRTKISQTLKTQNVKRVTSVNFNVSVGTVVPRRSYTFYPIPATIVSVVPAYRGYLYLVVGDQMLIIHPRTHEIVAVIAV